MAATKTAKNPSSTMDLGIIRYSYIPREVPGVTDKNHVLHGGKLPTSIDRYPVCVNKQGRYVLNLTDQEKEYITNGLGLQENDLNVFSLKNEYLSKIVIEVPKHGLALDTNEPWDLLVDKILQGYDNIFAPNIQSKNYKKSYRYVRHKQSEETVLALQTSDLKKKAYKLLGALEDSRERMIMFLLNSNMRLHPTVKTLELKRLVNEVAEANFTTFVNTLEDDLFIEKGLINMAIILEKVQVKSGLHFFDGQPLAFKGDAATFDKAAVYLKDKANSLIKVALSKETLDAFIGN